jgi:hypothetical protein
VEVLSHSFYKIQEGFQLFTQILKATYLEQFVAFCLYAYIWAHQTILLKEAWWSQPRDLITHFSCSKTTKDVANACIISEYESVYASIIFKFVGFEVLTAMTMKSKIFWV